jgi:hypothetical protein
MLMGQRAKAVVIAAALSAFAAAVLPVGVKVPRAPTTVSAAAPATPEQQAAAAKLVEDVKAGSARFVDIQTALSEGYQQTTPFRFGQWGPAHFNNRQYAREKRYLDPERPTALVYLRTQDVRSVLIGVMFLAPKGQGPRPGGPVTEWHVHDNLCITSTGAADVAMAPGQCPPGSTFLGAAIEMMHVWIFDNPDGPYAHRLTVQGTQAAIRYAARR